MLRLQEMAAQHDTQQRVIHTYNPLSHTITPLSRTPTDEVRVAPTSHSRNEQLSLHWGQLQIQCKRVTSLPMVFHRVVTGT